MRKKIWIKFRKGVFSTLPRFFGKTQFYPDLCNDAVHPNTKNEFSWQVIEKYKVSQFYTAPTAIRALMKFGEDFVNKYDLSSLSVLGTVGKLIHTSTVYVSKCSYVPVTNC